jgi:hypothetical protein
VLAGAPAQADPGYYVMAPYGQAGVGTVEFRYWTVKPNRQAEANWPEIGVAYGVTERWRTLLLASWIGDDHHATRLETLNWQNTVMLTDGNTPVDVALHLQVITDPSARLTATEQGLLLQTEFGLSQANLNLIVERPRGPGLSELKLQWQWRQRISATSHVGLMGFDELGPPRHWLPHAQQSHRAGPMFDTSWPGAGKGKLTLMAGWLLGRSYGSSGHMFTLRLAADF